MGWLASPRSSPGSCVIQSTPPPLPPPVSCPITVKKPVAPPSAAPCPYQRTKVVPPCSRFLSAILKILCNGGRFLTSIIVLAIIIGLVYWWFGNYDSTYNDEIPLRSRTPETSTHEGPSRKLPPPPPSPPPPRPPPSPSDWLIWIIFTDTLNYCAEIRIKYLVLCHRQIY